ncbi:MAG TPA: hypothetical protein VJB94_01225 [Candidatus Nanoarchaeia archaeon]|nr:hypothetical protein [Candidatus Nanoarchaeia archaeon]
MGWKKKAIESDGIWTNWKDSSSVSGCKHEVIFGASGIGSPHGHVAFFNNQIIYNRQMSGLTAYPSSQPLEDKIIIIGPPNEKKESKMVIVTTKYQKV